MKVNRNLVAAVALGVIILVIAAAACAKPVVQPNANVKDTNSVAQTANQANAKPAAKKDGLLDAPLNRNKFPNSTLKTNDTVTFVGRTVKIEGAGYPSGTKLDLVYGTFAAKFKLGEQNEFYTHELTERNIPIATVQADSAGKFSYDFAVSEDYGGNHNIYAISDGEKVMQTGLNIRTEYFVSPLSGPSGTPIHVRVTGIGYGQWEEVRSIAYDNQYTGLLVGMLTNGTAEATIHASGGIGKHNLRVSSAGVQLPYMNIQQSPVYFPGRVKDYTFMVTSAQPDPKSVEPQADWQDKSYPDLTANPGMVGPKGERLTVTPNAATVGATLKLSAKGFAPNSTIELQWEAMRGNRSAGWSAQSFPLDNFITDVNGNYEKQLKMPDDLGGMHALVALVGGNRVADARVIVEPSILDITPKSGPAGTEIKIVLKGVGWTELDNTYIMDYDNAITGYACGFNSAGDVTIIFNATGAPGWHYIDFYPTIYVGHVQPPWLPGMPWLSPKSHPGLPKPSLHVAFQITE